jgi:hypothetical protein
LKHILLRKSFFLPGFGGRLARQLPSLLMLAVEERLLSPEAPFDGRLLRSVP